MRKALVNLLVFSLCLLASVGSSWAEFKDVEVHFLGESYRIPMSSEGEGGTLFQVETSSSSDKEEATASLGVDALMSRVGARVQWSSSFRTCIVFSSKGSKIIKVPEGQKGQLPWSTFVEALGLGAQKNNDGWTLSPQIFAGTSTSPELGLPDAATLSHSYTATPVFENRDHQLRIFYPHAQLEGRGSTWYEQEISFEAGQSKNEEGVEGVSVLVKAPVSWKLRGEFRATEGRTRIVLEPNFSLNPSAPLGHIIKETPRKDHSRRWLILDWDQPLKASWSFSSRTGVFSLDIPQIGMNRPIRQGYLDDLFEESQQSILELSGMRVLRVSGVAKAGEAIEVVEVLSDENQLGIVAMPKAENSGIDHEVLTMTGYPEFNYGTIVIDPGHGGSDRGCMNHDLGLEECQITLEISKRLAEVLRSQGWHVILTRETDRDVTYAGSPDKMELQARSNIANDAGADIFISIHCNASVNRAAQGSSIHWWKPEDYELAVTLEHVLGPNLGFAQKGLIRDRFAVLRYAKMPSVLVETAFLSNNYEGSLLGRKDIQLGIARQLAGGLARYMHQRYAKKAPVERR